MNAHDCTHLADRRSLRPRQCSIFTTTAAVITNCRVAELEGLLAGMRAREFRSDFASDRAGGQLAVMVDRNRALEEQVGRPRRGCDRIV